MARIVWPYDDPFVYNTLIIGPHVIPGRAELTKGIPAKRSVDRKKAKGKSGGTTTDNGLELVTGIVYHIHQTRREHHDAWQIVYPAISPAREGATKEPFECLNAYLAERGLSNLTVVGIVCNPYDSKGKRIIEIELDEWMPAPKTVKKGTGSPKAVTKNFVKPIDADKGWLLSTSELVPDASRVSDPSDPNEVNGKIGMLGK